MQMEKYCGTRRKGLARGLTSVLALLLLIWAAGTAAAEAEHLVLFENGRVYMDGEPVPEYDYTWHADPSAARGGTGDAPAEYFTGTEPSRAYYEITGEKGEPSGDFIPDGPVSCFVDIEDSAGDAGGIREEA